MKVSVFLIVAGIRDALIRHDNLRAEIRQSDRMLNRLKRSGTRRTKEGR
jgi:hypothetical protein